MNKRGQFYLIAALVIVSIAASLATVKNTASSPNTETILYDLSNEMIYEAGQVIDSGVLNSISDLTLKENLNNLTRYYANSFRDSDFLIIYGNESTLYFFVRDNTNNGNVGFTFGGSQVDLKIKQGQRELNSTQERTSNKITVVLSRNIKH